MFQFTWTLVQTVLSNTSSLPFSNLIFLLILIIIFRYIYLRLL